MSMCACMLMCSDALPLTIKYVFITALTVNLVNIPYSIMFARLLLSVHHTSTPHDSSQSLAATFFKQFGL